MTAPSPCAMCCLIPGFICKIVGTLCFLLAILAGVLVILHLDGNSRETLDAITRNSRKIVTALADNAVDRDAALVAHPAYGVTKCLREEHFLLRPSDGAIIASVSMRQTAGYVYEMAVSGLRWRPVEIQIYLAADEDAPSAFVSIENWNMDAGPLRLIVDRDANTLGYRLPGQRIVRTPIQWNVGGATLASWTPCYGGTIVYGTRMRLCNPANPQECTLAAIAAPAARKEGHIIIKPCCSGACCSAGRCKADWTFQDDCFAPTQTFVSEVDCKPATCLVNV